MPIDFGGLLASINVYTYDELPKLSPVEVKAVVREVMATFAPGGGYILAASHNIQDDTPAANVAAMYEAGLECGRYPLAAAGAAAG